MAESSSAFAAETLRHPIFHLWHRDCPALSEGVPRALLYALFMFVPALFVLHGDISRYLLPIAPFALILGFDAILPKKRIHYLIPLALLCIAGYLYCLAVLPTNLLPQNAFDQLSQLIGMILT
jgi:Na+-translocating ferredoxin:NAD+ oxidoreductase RnfD subunit